MHPLLKALSELRCSSSPDTLQPAVELEARLLRATVPAGSGTRPSVSRRILMTRGFWPCATRTWVWSSLRVQPASFPSPLEDSNSRLSNTSSTKARLRDSLNPRLLLGVVCDPSQSPVPRAAVQCCVTAVPGVGLSLLQAVLMERLAGC